MGKPIRVRLLGRDYTLRVREEDEALTYEMAAYVSDKMDAFKAAHPEQSEITAAVITALALAEELFTLRSKNDAREHTYENDLSALEQRLSEVLMASS